MLNYEKLMSMHNHIKFKEVSHLPAKLDGLTYGDTIFLNDKLHTYEKNAILGEEIGHYYTNSGDIIDYSDLNQYRNEVKGRRYGYEINLPLDKLIECYQMNLDNVYLMSEHLELPVQYLWRAIQYYKTKYDNHTEYDGYSIRFQPLCIERGDKHDS